MKKQVTVLGGGPGGYATALYCAHLGMDVMMVEQQQVGGTCLNRGCIPTKVFVQASNVYAQTMSAAMYGVQVPEGVSVDFARTSKLKQKIVKRLRGGVGYLLEKAGVKVINGAGRLLDAKTVEVATAEGPLCIASDAIVLATGSSEIELPNLPADGVYVLNSTQMLDLQELPERTAIVGGGVIGVEFASLLARFGKEVSIVEMSPSLIPTEDADVAEALRASLKKAKVKIMTQTQALGVRREGNDTILSVQGEEGDEELAVDMVLVCIGRRPNLAGLGLDEVGVRYDKRCVETDGRMETSVPGIYAVGDITASPQLAHVAYHEAKVAALNLAGRSAQADYRAVPGCIFSHPEVSRAGMTEREAREAYGDILVETESFAGNGKAMIENEAEGFVKMIFAQGEKKLVGCSIIGPKATELIAEPTLAIQLGLSADALSEAINAHPSLSEMIAETAGAAVGLNLHS